MLQRHLKCPFKTALHINKDTEIVVEDAELLTNSFIKKKGDRLNPKEKVSVITSPFLNNLEFPLLMPDSDLQNVHPFIKKSIPGNKNTSGPSSRKTKILSKVLGKNNQRPKHIGHYTRVSDTLQKKTLPKILREIRHVQGSENSGKPGDFRYVEKKAIRECQPHPNQFVSTLFLVSQEGWGQSSCDKLKKIEQVDPLSTLQDGSFALCEVHVATRRLHVQIRHEGCLIFGSLNQKLQGQCSFSMVREALQIPLSVFWLRTRAKNFYQNIKSANIPNEEIEYQNSYLSRRYVVAGKVNQGGSDSNRYNDFLVATSRICNQPQKFHSDSPTKNRTFRSAGGFSQHVIVFYSRETDESEQPMFGDVQDRESVHLTIDKAHRSFKFNSTSRVTCTKSISVTCKISPVEFHQKQGNKTNTLSDREYNSTEVFGKDERCDVFGNDQIKQRDTGLSSITWDHN